MQRHARSLSSSSDPGCKNCSISLSKISHAEYLILFGHFVISHPSHAMAVRQAVDTLLILLFSPFSNAWKIGFPILMMPLATLLHQGSVEVSCKSMKFSLSVPLLP